MKMPHKASWGTYELEFKGLWHFLKCVNAIDGKHVVKNASPNSGTSYFNYKSTFSIVFSIASANYEIIAVDVGSAGRFSDGG